MTAGIGLLPNSISFVGVLLALNAAALGVMFLGRRLANKRSIGPILGSWATTAGALCALLFTFTIANLWNNDRATEANVDNEAATLRMIARDIRLDQMPLVRRYPAASIAEWPQLCTGAKSTAAASALDELERTAVAKDAKYDDDLYAQLSTLEALHFKRMRATEPAVPADIWAALWILSLGVLFVLGYAALEHVGLQIALTAAVGTSLGVLFWVTALFSRPFCGPAGITPQALVETLRALSAQ